MQFNRPINFVSFFSTKIKDGGEIREPVAGEKGALNYIAGRDDVLAFRTGFAPVTDDGELVYSMGQVGPQCLIGHVRFPQEPSKVQTPTKNVDRFVLIVQRGTCLVPVLDSSQVKVFDLDNNACVLDQTRGAENNTKGFKPEPK